MSGPSRIVRVTQHAPHLLPKPKPVRVAAKGAAARPARRACPGLGDWVWSWAHPLAKRLDAVTARLPVWGRTALAGCMACSRRRRLLNLIVPDRRAPASWGRSLARILPAWRSVYGPPARPSKTP